MNIHRGFLAAALHRPCHIACGRGKRQCIWLVVPVQLNPLPNIPYSFLVMPHGRHQAAKPARSFLDGRSHQAPQNSIDCVGSGAAAPMAPPLSKDTANIARETYLSWAPAESEETH